MSKPDEAIRLRRQMHEQRQTLRGLNRRLARVETENMKLRRDRRDIVNYVEVMLNGEVASDVTRDIVSAVLKPLQAALAAGGFAPEPVRGLDPRNPPTPARLQAECGHMFVEAHPPDSVNRPAHEITWKCTDCGLIGAPLRMEP